MTDSRDSPIDIKKKQEFVEIRFNRPEKRNAINFELAGKLRESLEEVRENGEKGLLLTGKGLVTTAGADTSVVADGSSRQKQEIVEDMNEIYSLLYTYHRPTVMAVEGAAIGGGLQLAVLCDFVVAGKQAKFSKPEIEFGVYSGFSTALLVDILGKRAAKDIALTGKSFTAQEALELGIVSEVVPKTDVEARVVEILTDLTTYDPTAYKKTKESVNSDLSKDDFENHP